MGLVRCSGRKEVVDTATDQALNTFTLPVNSNEYGIRGRYSGITVVDTSLLLANPDGAIEAQLPVGSVWGVSLTPDGYYLYAADTNGIFMIIDTRNLSVRESFNFVSYDVVALPFCAE